MVTHPTFVVGAGQAGVNVMKMLHEVAEQNDETDKFSFVAVDTDRDTLNKAPPSATRFTLDIEDDFLGEDLKSYPYLTRSMNIESKGAKRQRPVGRYKLDNKGKFDAVRTGLRDELRSHFDSVEVQLGEQSASFNIFYIHSLGGGTGSGTYPLLAGILNDVAGDLNTEHVYMAGVGVAPIVLSPDEDSPAEFPGRPIYYPNAYAGLNDLEQLEMLDFEEENRELLIQSQGGTGQTESFVFDEPPFDDYWLIGVNERRVQGGLGDNVGPETYRGELNQTIARSLHAITQVGQSAENWTQGRPVIGTLDQATISVPHEQVRNYCELKSERENLETQRDTEIPNEIERIEDRKAELEEIKSHLDPDEIVDEQLKDDLLGRLETDQNFLGGKYIVDNKTVDEVEAALRDISQDEEYDIEGEIIAADILERKLREEEAVPQIEQEHKDVVQNLWSKYNMQNEPGGGNVRALETKAGMLDEYLREEIADHKEILEEWDPNTLERIVDTIPPFIDMFETEREYAEAVVDELQSDYDDLDAIRSEWGRAEKMKDAVGGFKRGIRKRIQNQIDEKNDRITELQNERDELDEEIRGLTTNIESLVEELTTASLSRRIAVLPLKRAALEALDEQRLEQFDDMEAYVGELVDRDKTRNALSQRLKFAEAWNNYIIDGDFEDAKYSSDEYRRNYTNVSQDEMWILHSESTGNLLNTINRASDADVTKQSGGELQYLTDAYRIEFVSFTRRGPVSRLKLYQVLSRHAENGELESLAGNYDDYRQAFAYPEWYGRDVQEAFDISAQVTVTSPPELDLDRVDKPDLSEGELKNYVKTNGLDSYVWEGMMWDTYRETEDEQFVGWKEGLRENAVGFTDLQKATPDADLKAKWMAGQAEWEDIVTAYRNNLVDRTGVELQFE